MAWSAELIQRSLVRGQLSLTIRYTDSGRQKSFNESIAIRSTREASQAKMAIQLRLKELESLTALNAQLIDGPIIPDPTPPTPDPPPPPPPPTQDEIDRATWLDSFSKLQTLLLLVDMGLLLTTDARVSSLKTSLTAGFKDSYLDGIG